MDRRDGVFYAKRRCGDGRIIALPLLFSFKEEKFPGGKIRGYSFSPPGVLELLKESSPFLLKDSFKKCLVKARVVEAGKDWALIEITGEQFKDKRLFDRFSFCPEEFGEFEVRKRGERVGRGFIVDLSLTGVKVELEGKVRAERGELLTLTRGTKVIEVKVVRSSEEGGKRVIGGKITSSNFCVVKMIIESYTKVVKEFLTKIL